MIDIDRLRDDIATTIAVRDIFARLGCRGFSYRLWTAPEFAGDELSPELNVKVALMPDDGLFYPRRVKAYLRRTGTNHLRADGFGSIAFALGSVHSGQCLIAVLQSDVARRRQPSYVREHFRGWRKVLLSLICVAVADRADTIVIPRAADVARACHASFPAAPAQITVWETIYDRTALDFGLVLTKLKRPIDLRVYAERPAVWADTAYIGDIGRLTTEG